jgi:hypothetical protein
MCPLNILCLTNLSDQIPQSLSYFTTQYWLAVFGYPNYVILVIVYGVAGFAIMFHTASILKSSPKGEGFSPIPRGGQ